MPLAAAAGVAPCQLKPNRFSNHCWLVPIIQHGVRRPGPATTGIVFPLVSIACESATSLQPPLARPSQC